MYVVQRLTAEYVEMYACLSCRYVVLPYRLECLLSMTLLPDATTAFSCSNTLNTLPRGRASQILLATSYRMPSEPGNEGSKCASVTFRAISVRPYHAMHAVVQPKPYGVLPQTHHCQHHGARAEHQYIMSFQYTVQRDAKKFGEIQRGGSVSGGCSVGGGGVRHRRRAACGVRHRDRHQRRAVDGGLGAGDRGSWAAALDAHT